MTGIKLIDVSDGLIGDTSLCHVAYLAAMQLTELYRLGPCGDALVTVLNLLGDLLTKRERQVEKLLKRERQAAQRKKARPQPSAGELRLVRPGEAGAAGR